MSQRVALSLDTGPQAVTAARHALGSLEAHVERPVLDDLRLLVSELVTNSVRHSDAAPPAPVDLEVFLSPSVVRVEVRDHGAGFEPGPPTPRHDATGGWGLYLVDRLSDRWGVVRNAVTSVWFEIDRTRGAV